jgi:hypothetical protein
MKEVGVSVLGVFMGGMFLVFGLLVFNTRYCFNDSI